jgi:hypothetical protein
MTLVDEQHVARYADDAHEAFDEAARRRGLLEVPCSLAGSRIRIRLAGDALERYAVPALSHHVSGDSQAPADLTISVFDTESTGVQMPRPVWPKTAYSPTCEITGLGVRFLAAFNVGTGTFDLLDTHSGAAIHWIADAADHPAFEASAPFRIILHWWMRLRGLQFLHGGAVGTTNGGVLLAGKGRAGKSTIALTCLIDGMSYAGDDYVLAGVDPHPEAHNIYQTAKLAVADVGGRFPELESAIHGYTDVAGRDKAILMLDDVFPGRVVDRLRLAAIVVPQLGGFDQSRLRPADDNAALTALVPSVVRQLTAVRRDDLDAMRRLVDALPAFVLEIGPDLESVPGLLTGLLEER